MMYYYLYGLEMIYIIALVFSSMKKNISKRMFSLDSILIIANVILLGFYGSVAGIGMSTFIVFLIFFIGLWDVGYLYKNVDQTKQESIMRPTIIYCAITIVIFALFLAKYLS